MAGSVGDPTLPVEVLPPGTGARDRLEFSLSLATLYEGTNVDTQRQP